MMSLAERTVAVACSLVLTSSLPETSASAEETRPIRVRLHWTNQTGDATCLDEEALAKAVESRLQRQAFVDASPDLVLDGSVMRESGKRIASMTLRRPDGELVGRRELESPDRSCSTLNEAVPLSVALMIDYQQRVLRLHVPAIKPAAAAPPPPPRPKPAPVPTPSPSNDDRWRLGSRAGAAAEIGALPGLSWSTHVSFEASRGWPSLRLEAAWLVPRSASFDEGEVTLAGWTLGAAGCGSWLRTDHFRSALCMGGEAGRLLSTGGGFERNKDSASMLANAWLGADALAYLYQDWGLSLGLVGGTPLVKQRLEYTNAGGETPSLFEASTLFARMSLSFVYAPRGSDQKFGR